MESELQNVIEKMVKSIYRLETNKIQGQFIELLDRLENFLSQYPKKEINSILLMLQEAYIRKDYVFLSDILLYDLLPNIMNE